MGQIIHMPSVESFEKNIQSHEELFFWTTNILCNNFIPNRGLLLIHHFKSIAHRDGARNLFLGGAEVY